MACPYFFPLRPADSVSRPQPARAPLGKVHGGECKAAAVPAFPTEDQLYGPCNFGYGRGCCEMFPPDAPADAVRFATIGGRLTWVLEKDWAPVRHGFGEPDDEVIARQAAAFLHANR